MRICFVSTMTGVPWGGSEFLWSATARLALEEGHPVACLTHRFAVIPKPLLELQDRGARLYFRSAERSRRRVRAWERFVFPLPSLARWRPDVICFSQGGIYEAVVNRDLVGLTKRGRVPYVVVCQHNTDGYIPPASLRARALTFFRAADQVVFVAAHNRRALERQLAQVLPNSCVLGNPVNLRGLDAVPWPETPEPRLACVARLDTLFKGQDVLFEALSDPVWKERAWRLRLYGEGQDAGYLRSLAVHFGIGDRVEFAGQVGDVRSIWADNQLLVLPSRSEGTPLVLVEAMICGRPAVVTDVGGNLEWVEEPQTGFTAAAPTAASVGAALERAWQARGEWPAIGARARRRALAQHDPAPERTLLRLLDNAFRKRQGGAS